MTSLAHKPAQWRFRGQCLLALSLLVAVAVRMIPGLADEALVAAAIGFALGLVRRR